MKLFAIADLHLYKGIKDKPMDIFGSKWERHMERLFDNWNRIVSEDDTVLIPGDISWATYLKESLPDFLFIEKLNGRKIISKGNHDYWWVTAKKLDEFILENNIKSISFLHNNFFEFKDYAICGCRLWDIPSENSGEEDIKIYKRELLRLEISLNAARKKDFSKIIVMTHYPPFKKNGALDDEILSILKKHEVSKYLYGHLHHSKNLAKGVYHDIEFLPVMADYLEFIPYNIVI